MREPYAVKVARTVPGREEDDNIFSLFDEEVIRQGDGAQTNYKISETLPRRVVIDQMERKRLHIDSWK